MNVLERAIRNDNFNHALADVQAALDIETGDVAAQVFAAYDDLDNLWRASDHEVRRHMLTGWLTSELIYAVPS